MLVKVALEVLAGRPTLIGLMCKSAVPTDTNTHIREQAHTQTGERAAQEIGEETGHSQHASESAWLHNQQSNRELNRKGMQAICYIVMMTNMFFVAVRGLVVFACIFEHISHTNKIYKLSESHNFY